MGSGSISTAGAPVPPTSRDLGKNTKKANRLAKLKQCKLDVRREQWLAHVKSRECNVDSNERKRSMDILETRSRGMEKEGLIRHDSDVESMMNRPSGARLGHSDSGKQFGGSTCSSTSSSGFCSQSVSEEGEEGCLDDWEAVADALTTDDSHNSLRQPVISVSPGSCQPRNDNCRVNMVNTDARRVDSGSPPTSRAWRPDDAYRPRSLPILSKQQCSPVHSGWHCGRGHGQAIPWAWQSIVPQPSSCPICYEDFDLTDSSFLPCSCGFRLCLFCHKRIMEADGRCPGCRKHYDSKNGNVGFKARGNVLPCDSILSP